MKMSSSSRHHWTPHHQVAPDVPELWPGSSTLALEAEMLMSAPNLRSPILLQ
jgi:hypothetical protein